MLAAAARGAGRAEVYLLAVEGELESAGSESALFDAEELWPPLDGAYWAAAAALENDLNFSTYFFGCRASGKEAREWPGC